MKERKIGKSHIIREVEIALYDNYVAVNFVVDDEGEKIFKHVHTTEEFYLKLGMVAGAGLDKYEKTLAFMDEIQHFSQFLIVLNILYLLVCYVMSMEH